jgi:hypothetical protein
LAGGLGFEPRLAESESAVLPLDDPPSRGCADSTNLRDWVGSTALLLRRPNIGFDLLRGCATISQRAR